MLIIGTSVTWSKAVFSKILIFESQSQLLPHFPENYIQILQADCLEVVFIWAPFERQKIEAHIIERTNLSGFGTWDFTAKEEINRRKQVFLLNFRPWSAQKPKIWSIFYGKKFI